MTDRNDIDTDELEQLGEYEGVEVFKLSDEETEECPYCWGEGTVKRRYELAIA